MGNTANNAWLFLALLMAFGGCKEDPKEAAPKEDGWVVLGAKEKASDLASSGVSVGKALENEKGVEVVVKGEVGQICPRGCWFYLKDDKDTIYVNVLGALEIPQDAKGKKAVVKAKIEGSGGGKTLEATTVLIEDTQ